MQTPAAVRDPERLRALRATAMVDGPAEVTFDRLTELAATILRVPVALVSLVEGDRQFFVSQRGLPEPWASARQTPLSHSFCQHVAADREPLIVTDARGDALLRDNLAISDLGVIAYAGVPLWTSEGQVLGSFCAIDHQPREWQPHEIEVLRGLAASAMVEIELRQRLREQQGEAERLQMLATEDSLTGLRNRRGFTLLAEQAWGVARRKGWELVLLFIDLDNFKEINDRFGHAEGDRVLRDVAEMLRSIYRSTDIAARMAESESGGLARLGGDEFVVLALEVQDGSQELLVDRLRAALHRFNAESGRPYEIACSIGTVSAVPDGSSSLEEMLSEADRRMYEAKRCRRAERVPAVA